MLNTIFTEIQTKYATGERNFQNYQLKKANLRGVTLKDVNLSGVDLSYADLRDVDLSGSNLKKCYLKGADLRGSNLNNVKFDGADLTEVNFTGAKLINAHFRNAILEGAYLSNTNLESAYLVEADLSKTFLNDANLSNANLKFANLKGAFLMRANLAGTHFQEANLSDASLSGAIINNTYFRDSEYNDNTRFSIGFNPEAIGMKKSNGITIRELLETLNYMSKCANSYLGVKISVKYLESSRPNCDWLNNFEINNSGTISFTGSGKQAVTQMQLKWYQQWIREYVTLCSQIIKGFSNLVEKQPLPSLKFSESLAA